MKDTPETDAFIASQNHSPTTHQLKNFARIFERERDEARELAHRFRSLYYTQLGIESSASWFPWEGAK